jgi:murein tripeptide amidase MpaA
MMKRIFLNFILATACFNVFSQNNDWLTWYERSGGTETPRYEQTILYCRNLASASPRVHYMNFGKSAQGRDLPLLIVDKDGLTDPQAIRSKGRIIILFQACIHPGESEGKDAGMMLIRDMVTGGQGKRLSENPHQSSRADLSALLDGVSLLFIPIFNVDGHERFGPYNRINQNGPKEMGWRVNANNLNLNRDYLKAETPEMQAWLKLFNHWMPDFFIDSHTTDGADYQYVLTYQIEISGGMDEGLTRWAKDDFIPEMKDRLMGSGYPIIPYVNFRNWHDPQSGLISNVSPPMLSQGYTALRNRPGLLIETHMLKPYDQRVEGTYACVRTTLEILQKKGKNLKQLEQKADAYLLTEDFLKTPFPLQFETSMHDSTIVPFLGVGYKVVKSKVSGGEWIRYNKIPATYNIPYFSKAIPVVTVKLPYAYIIPVEWEEIISRLELHGAKIIRTKRDTVISIVTCRFKNPKWQQNTYEGHHALTNIEYDEITEARLIPKGSAIVLLNQQCGRIIPHFLEPKGSGSMVYWGYFDAVFEQKEYAENYVLEQLAEKMLSENPGLGKELDAKKVSDTTFAKSPQLILNWFYSQSPYIDKRKGIYPVGRIYDPAIAEALIKQQ